MERLSPKIEIINHFDNMINRIDIDIDSSIEKYNDQQLLREIHKSFQDNRKNFIILLFDFFVKPFHPFNSSNQSLNSWPESTKVVDYLNQIRMKTIEELKIAQEETLEYYKINSEYFRSEQTKDIEELRSKLFAKKFYFQVNFKQSKHRLWAFNVFTFVTDFYISQSDILSLEKLINYDTDPFGRNCIFDDKMVLTGLLYKFFVDNIFNFPAHVIHVRKQDVLNIKSIVFNHVYSGVNLISPSTIDLSKLEDLNLIDTSRSEPVKLKIEGLSSLKKLQIDANTFEFDFSIKNLPSLTSFYLTNIVRLDERIETRILHQVQHIQQLHLDGKFSYFKLDNFVNLRVLSLTGKINENFNLELFKNLCKQIEDIKICICNIDEKTLFKLFDGYNFPYLTDFSVRFLSIKRLTKEFINRLPKPRNKLNISDCEIELIERDSFSNMQQLSSLNLSRNRIELIEKNAFSNLNNLETLDLRFNKLTKFDRKFIGLGNSVNVNIENNEFNS